MMPLRTQILIMVLTRGKNRIYINTGMFTYMYWPMIFITVEKVLIDEYKNASGLLAGFLGAKIFHFYIQPLLIVIVRISYMDPDPVGSAFRIRI